MGGSLPGVVGAGLVHIAHVLFHQVNFGANSIGLKVRRPGEIPHVKVEELQSQMEVSNQSAGTHTNTTGSPRTTCLQIGLVHFLHEHVEIVVGKDPLLGREVLQNADCLLDSLLKLDESKITATAVKYSTIFGQDEARGQDGAYKGFFWMMRRTTSMA